MTRRRILRVVATLGIAVASRPSTAQMVRGVVVDGATRAPIPSAVVTTMDSAGRVGRRSLTNDQGAYYVTAPAQASRLRIVRLGFRPVDLPISAVVALTVRVFVTRNSSVIFAARIRK